MLDLNKIVAKFSATPKQIEQSQADEENYPLWKQEHDAWETKCYNEKTDSAVFRNVRDEIDVKYGYPPTSTLPKS